MPATAAALADGRLSYPKVRALVDELGQVADGAARDREEARLLERAPEQTPAQVRRAARRAALRLQPQDAAERERAARQRRRAWLTPLPDGMAEFGALLPAAQAMGLWTVLTGLADQARTPGDQRCLDQRRADTLADLPHLCLGSGVETCPAGTAAAPRSRS